MPTLLRLTDRGLYCEAGDFHVDPWGAVPRAVVTHAHGDHVAWGCEAYLTRAAGLVPLRARLDADARIRTLGDPAEWLAEWKWDGIRAQLIRRIGRTFLWSRGEELLSGRFPEIEEAAALLPDGTVLDGELLPWAEDAPLPKILEEVPVVLVVYDLLEESGADLRVLPFEHRRRRLARLLERIPSAWRLKLSPAIEVGTWAELTGARRHAREVGAEGLMLKRLGSAYGVGRHRGDWWKWKVDALSVDAVLLYAQPGSGRRAGLFTDAEIRRVDAFIRRNTLEKFGPVRTVKPELVFELAFEGIQRSTRHKSGIAVRFPRMARWRTDKRPEQADTIETVRALLGPDGRE
jgi:DNA ligase-1